MDALDAAVRGQKDIDRDAGNETSEELREAGEVTPTFEMVTDVPASFAYSSPYKIRSSMKGMEVAEPGNVPVASGIASLMCHQHEGTSYQLHVPPPRAYCYYISRAQCLASVEEGLYATFLICAMRSEKLRYLSFHTDPGKR